MHGRPGLGHRHPYGIIAPLLHGVTSIVDEAEFDAQRWWRILHEQQVSVWYTAPTAIRMLMKAGAELARRYSYPKLRFVASVGEPLNEQFKPAVAVHIGVAISLRQGGLIAPALYDVDGKPLAPLMQELADLVRRCRAGSLRSSEMTDACVTVTNLGDQGVEAVMGVIYLPQVALVGFGRVARRPWIDAEGKLGAIPTVTASLAADHRVSDGHRGALFLAELRELLQQPELDFIHLRHGFMERKPGRCGL
ncbi:MAG: 2-oxo acid dehydrogenase subunit E2 [Polaromonas sp.]